MMNFSNLNPSAMLTWFHVHFFFGALVLIGLILFIVWALRSLKKEDMSKWIWGLLVVGLIGWLLTAGSGIGFWGGGWGFGGSMMGRWSKGGVPTMMEPMMMRGILNCQKDTECAGQIQNWMNQMMQGRWGENNTTTNGR